MTWRVVPLTKGQLLDVDPDDVLEDGLYRSCNTYKSGGGYDIFPSLAKKRWGLELSQQFVVQLYGCHLDCYYCYVTREGVWGDYVEIETPEIVEAFARSEQHVLHLMGGSPALYIQRWPEILDAMTEGVFHSDLLLDEKPYEMDVLKAIARYNALYAVNVKGITPEEYSANTRKIMHETMQTTNLSKLMTAEVPFYVTFTGIERERAHKWMSDRGLIGYIDYDVIPIIDYKALPFVDSVPWGAQV